MSQLRVGVVILPDLDWPVALDRWREAERIGFATAWTYDHLSWRSLRDGPWLGAVPLLAAVAASTSTLRIGTLVTTPNYRHPALLAKDVMTLDRISAGRIDLGIGAGGTGFDATVLGGIAPTPAERSARFAEFADLLDLLLREPAASSQGKFFSVNESRTYPGCVQRPRVPFTVAAAGPKAMRVVAKHGQAWVTYGPDSSATPTDWYDAVGGQAGQLDAACADLVRDPSSVDRVALVGLSTGWQQDSIGAWDDYCGRISELGFTDVVVHWQRPHDADLSGPAPIVFDEICSRLQSAQLEKQP